jgi:pimeloyl-[acyl-carrier protein] synthase
MTAPSLNLSSPEFIANPYAAFEQLRRAGGPVFMPHRGATGGMWLVTRYDDVAFVLKDAQTSKNARRYAPEPGEPAVAPDMLGSDPPDHTRLRGLANRAFTPQRVRELEPRILQIADELIDRLAAEPQADCIAGFALPLPVLVIAELLGVPAEDRQTFGAWSAAFIAGVDAFGSAEAAKASDQALLSLQQYFVNLIARRRAEPGPDLLSALIAVRDSHDRLSEGELISMCILLLVAGYHTTVNLLGNGLLALLRHPDQLARLRANPALMPSAVEEMLRYESPVQRATFRIAIAPVEVAGQVIEPGQQISAVIAAANRDPEHFAEPERFDIGRSPNRHLSFGLGIHFCLGAPLARTEARLGLGRLLERLPNLRLAEPSAPPDWRANTMFRGLRSLPVETR